MPDSGSRVRLMQVGKHKHSPRLLSVASVLICPSKTGLIHVGRAKTTKLHQWKSQPEAAGLSLCEVTETAGTIRM